ncbi:winged helix-turn-helix domain-containing protein [Methanolobus sp. WCC5]|uniref:winged helix-turn-helix domain-containing protein n=1 Tax=Methanolobus sp. WCC5 TaxID=3125785 RepID=UPI00325434F3
MNAANQIRGITIRRSELDITLAILKIAMRGAKKTHIVYNANLNSTIANKYLVSMQDNLLVEQKGDLFITTEKGRTYREIASGLEIH